jgi:hypothetical protein
MLKERWKAILLGYLKPYLDADFKEMLYGLSWYVYVNLKPLDLSALRSYIGRYAKKPVIAENRITDYDGKTVTFFYEERNNPIRIYTKLSAEEFILKLIQHISPPHKYLESLSSPLWRPFNAPFAPLAPLSEYNKSLCLLFQLALKFL